MILSGDNDMVQKVSYQFITATKALYSDAETYFAGCILKVRNYCGETVL